MNLNASEIDAAAARLHEMVGGADETRSIENPNIPITADQLASLASYGPTRSGIQINENSAKTFTAAFAAIKILTESVGMLPLNLYRMEDDGDVRRRANTDPLDDLLSARPNDQMPPIVFKETVQQFATAWGNGYARINFNGGGKPAELLPLDSSKTHPERIAGQLRYKVDGGGTFAPEEILHVRGFGSNGLEGFSPVAYCREAFALGKAAEIFGAGFYGNGTALSGVISHPKSLTPEAIKNLRVGWQNQYSGTGNAFKAAVLEEGATWTPTGMPMTDAEFLATRAFQVLEVARIYRLPPHMLGDLSHTTKGSVEQAGMEFLVYSLLPWLLKWEEEFTLKLCRPGSGLHVRFDTKSLLRTDTASRITYYNAGRTNGWLSVNEIRREEGLPPIEGGDRYLEPLNMVDVDPNNRPDPSATSTPAAGAPGAAGGANPTPMAGGHAGAGVPQVRSEAMQPIFEDAFSRMLRKESNAAGRGNANERFYSEHRGHVREALMPAAEGLCRLLGVEPANMRDLGAILDHAADERSTQPADARGRAELIIAKLTEATKGTK